MTRAGSFEDFFGLEQRGLVRYAALLTGSVSQGEDIVQEVLVRLYLRWDQVQAGEGNILAYARRAVTNEHLSWRRRWNTRNIHPTGAGTDLPDSSFDPWYDRPDDELWQRLQALPSRPRAAVIMRYYQDLTDPEIAAVLGCREGTVRAHVSRGLAALRTEYAPRIRVGSDDQQARRTDPTTAEPPTIEPPTIEHGQP
ncbi:RNA polymerase sigma-70 factor (sigma-E family) [Nakamurella sp. UYEF19]|uniref:SigE family RNA polymerase sigma factor n=1 Tax=Nakamurella sp. UYEF19 TaxID=1756392 RepID=UPI0033998F9B